MIRRQISEAHFSTLGLTLLLLWILTADAVTAQTGTANPAPTPKSVEVLKLEEEKAQAELRKAIAEANKAELEAKFPKPTSSPLAGTTTINDNAIIESQMVAYLALARAANKMVNGITLIPNLKVSKLAVFNEDDVRLLLSYKTSKSQLEVLRQSYCHLLNKKQTTGDDCPAQHKTDANNLSPESFVAPLAIARSLLGSFVDLTSFLRTNVEIKGHTFDIDEAPLVTEVFRASRRNESNAFRDTQFFYPRMYPPDFEPNKPYAILGAIEVVFRLRNTAGRLIAELEKNGVDLSKAETKVESLRSSVNSLTLARASALEKLKNILIPAHCSKVPDCDEDDLTGLEARLRKYCPKLAGDQRERILELASQIKRLDSDFAITRLNLANAQSAQAKLEGDRARLWDAFNTDSIAGKSDHEKNKEHALTADIAGQLKARNDQVDAFIAALVQAGTGGGVNALTSLIKAENIQSALEPSSSGQSYWLQLKVLKAGGNNRIKTNLLWDLFTGGNRVSHSGGVIVEYILFERTGRVVASDTITEYTNYIKADKVKKLFTAEVDDLKPLPKNNGSQKSNSVVGDQN
jgi:hypothetical protein